MPPKLVSTDSIWRNWKKIRLSITVNSGTEGVRSEIPGLQKGGAIQTNRTDYFI